MTSAEGRLFCTSCSKAALSEKWVLFPSLSGHNINNFVVGGGGVGGGGGSSMVRAYLCVEALRREGFFLPCAPENTHKTLFRNCGAFTQSMTAMDKSHRKNLTRCVTLLSLNFKLETSALLGCYAV